MSSLRYYSTNLKAPKVSFREALLKGQAPDKGLYLPELIPSLSVAERTVFSGQEYHEVAYTIAHKFLHAELPADVLFALVKDAYDYVIPLEQIYDNKYVMRLDQGPTASFKDFAARLMGRLMQYYLKQENKKLLILTATSGDTGSAIANAFYGLTNIEVIVLFPRTEVTPRQRKQMTTLGRNIRIIALDAKFDDCQALVKQAFSDPALSHLHLSSANSINIGRLLPQSMYYVYAHAKLADNPDQPVIFSVPSGNFGDMMGGLLAKRMGVPVKKFVIATNANDEFPRFIQNGEYHKIVPSKNCLSSAMNVGHPSNLARVVALYGGNMDETGQIGKLPDLGKMRSDMHAVSVADVATQRTIKQVYDTYGALLEPHGAVGWAGLNDYLFKHPEQDTADQLCVSLETAHPAKFPELIQKTLGIDPELPPSLVGIEDKTESYETMENDYGVFRKILME
ncbi:MAG TPA: threonine synthase [bacterium]|nr:threonine synthase [bacterium]